MKKSKKVESPKCLICESTNIFKVINDFNYCQKCYEMQRDEFLEMEKNRTEFYPSFNQITEKVYLGNNDAQRDKKLLKDNGITHILMCGNYLYPFHPEDFTYKLFNLDNCVNQQIEEVLEEAFSFIEKSEKVYVHCHAGVSRSATIVIAYIMWKNNLPYMEARQFVKERRKDIFPNAGFVKQLENFEKKLNSSDFKINI